MYVFKYIVLVHFISLRNVIKVLSVKVIVASFGLLVLVVWYSRWLSSGHLTTSNKKRSEQNSNNNNNKKLIYIQKSFDNTTHNGNEEFFFV